MPEQYSGINYQEIAALKEKHPKVYKKIQKRLETGWETTIELLEKGKSEGVIRQDVDIVIIKIMLESSLENLLSGDTLKKNKLKYIDALNRITDIIMNGITVN